MAKKDNYIANASIIHIGLSFKSYDGKKLNNRFMCVFSIENNDLILMPMSSFHSEEAKKQKLRISANFEYLKIHGNTRDGYIKYDQLYYLNKEEFNNFDELQAYRRMNEKHFEKLQNHVKNLQKNHIKFLKKRIVFEDLFVFNEKEQCSDSILTKEKLLIMQKNMQKIRKYEKALKKSQQVAQEVDEDNNEFDDYEH